MIHPTILQFLHKQSGNILCPFCQYPLHHGENMKKFGYINDQYYECKQIYYHRDICHNDLYISQTNSSTLDYLSFSFPESNYYDYEVQMNMEKDEMNVQLATAHVSSQLLLTCPIPRFNFFDLHLLTKKIKLYQVFS